MFAPKRDSRGAAESSLVSEISAATAERAEDSDLDRAREGDAAAPSDGAVINDPDALVPGPDRRDRHRRARPTDRVRTLATPATSPNGPAAVTFLPLHRTH